MFFWGLLGTWVGGYVDPAVRLEMEVGKGFACD